MLIQKIQFNTVSKLNNKRIMFCGNQEHALQSANIRQELDNMAQINMPVITTSEIRETSDKYLRHTLANYVGCLLGGAIGDALGAPVEFMSLDEIKQKYGKNGIQDLELNEHGKAEFTDDTQMTMFTAEGLIKSALKGRNIDEQPDYMEIYGSYLGWYITQFKEYKENRKGMLLNTRGLYIKKGPGFTCVRSLKKKTPGCIDEPINNSKGSGGVMRIAPVGLMYYKNPELAFEVGAECAALTHGSPSAYLPAGMHSSIIANLIQGKTINEAIENSIKTLKKYKYNTRTLTLIQNAINLSKCDILPEEAISKLGEGWNGDEAIAIAIYSILKFPNDFKKALLTSVNHSGDSDTTGAITGNILGACLGEDKLPLKWKNTAEFSDILLQLATDLYLKPEEIDNSYNKYAVH